jgi:hypothetical protein
MLTTLFAAALLLQPAVTEPESPASGPPIVLTIDGVAHDLHDGKTVTITIDGKPHEVRIDLPAPSPITLFDGRQVRFDRPTSLVGGVVTDEGGTVAHQFLGAPAALIVFEFSEPIPFAAIFDDMAAQYGDDLVATGESVIEAEVGRLEGRFLTVAIADGHLRQEVYRIGNAEACTFIVLQDSREQNDEPTEPFTAMRDLLAKTLRTK